MTDDDILKRVTERAFETASAMLEDSVVYAFDFRPVILIQDAAGGLVGLFYVLDGREEAKPNWREILIFCARVTMTGFARAEYVTFVSDVYVKHADAGINLDFKRGDFERARAAGDKSITDALAVLTYGRGVELALHAPYYMNKKRRVHWTDKRGEWDVPGGYMASKLREAANGPRLIDMLAKEFGVDSSDSNAIWSTVGAPFFGGTGTPLSVIRAHQDAAALRVILEREELLGRVVYVYTPEDDAAGDAMDACIARLGEWNENLITARGPEEMFEKLRRQ